LRHKFINRRYHKQENRQQNESEENRNDTETRDREVIGRIKSKERGRRNKNGLRNGDKMESKRS
jgi:hypothetical protein